MPPEGGETLSLALTNAVLKPGSIPLIGKVEWGGDLEGDLALALDRSATAPLAGIRAEAELLEKGHGTLDLSLAGVAGTASAGSPLAIGSFRLDYRDGGLVDERMSALARGQGETREAAARRMAERFARSVRATKDGRLARAASELYRFLREPRSISVSVAPTHPVSPLVMMTLGLVSPGNLADMMDLQVRSQ
ncbi:MAG: hypothetical protein R3C97_13275 [Geminicoccaceae bacterium]